MSALTLALTFNFQILNMDDDVFLALRPFERSKACHVGAVHCKTQYDRVVQAVPER
jgi:hypothetical protein